MKQLIFGLCITLAFLSSAFGDATFDSLLEKAKAGDAAAQAKVGSIYAIGGDGIYRDSKEAVKWLTKSAEQGNREGEFALGLMYEYGRGVKPDIVAVLKWYQAAANQGDIGAQYRLAKLYDMGNGVPKDHAMAAKYYQEPAAKGVRIAVIRLAEMYEEGDGVKQDYAAAMKLYLTLPDDSSAQYKIGYFYEHGYGVPVDRQRAMEWYHKAAHESMEARHAINEMQQ